VISICVQARVSCFVNVLCRTQFSMSQDANVILTQSELGLYAYVCATTILFIPVFELVINILGNIQRCVLEDLSSSLQRLEALR